MHNQKKKPHHDIYYILRFLLQPAVQRSKVFEMLVRAGQTVQLMFSAATLIYALFVVVLCRSTPAPLSAKMGFAFVFVFVLCTVFSVRILP